MPLDRPPGPVTMLHPVFWPEVRRGSERMIADLAAGLDNAGVEARLITSHRGPREVRHESGLEVVRGRRLPEPPQRLGYHEYLGHVPSTARELRRIRAGVVHSLYPVDAALALGPARRRGVPSLFSVMGIASLERIRGNRGRRLIWRRALESDAVVALSEAAAEPLRELGAEPRVIHPGVDLTKFHNLGPRDPRPTIFCPASIDDVRKGIPVLLEAHRRLRADHPELRLVLDSAPGRKSSAPSQAGVELLAHEHGSLAASYSEAWVTALPSRDEAFGLILAESLACGTPVVGSDEGGIRDVVSDPAIGCRAQPGDAADLAAALSKALELTRRDGIAERCRAHAEGFSAERMAAAYLALYAELEAG